MNVLSLLAACAGLLNAGLGVHVLAADPRDGRNRVFFLMAECQALWSFTGILLYSAPDPAAFLFWFRLGSPFFLLYYPAALHFCLVLTNLLKRRRPAVILLYGMYGIVLYLMNFDLNTIQIHEFSDGYWRFDFVLTTWQFYFYLAFANACFLGFILLLLLWRRKVRTRRERLQAVVMLSSMVLAAVLANLEAYAVGAVTGYRSRGLSPLIFTVMTVGFFYAVRTYRLLSITKADIGGDIVEGLSDPVLLCDDEGVVVYANLRAERLFYRPGKALRGSCFKDLFPGAAVPPASPHETEFRAGVDGIQGLRILMNFRILSVRDRFGDPLGTLCLGREIHPPYRAKMRFGFTPREMDVLGLLIGGCTNKEIAAELKVSEITVKTHIRSIFNKTGADTRTRLLYALREYT